MNKRARILTIYGTGLVQWCRGCTGLAQTVQQPKAPPPQAEKAAVPAPQAEKRPRRSLTPNSFCKRCAIS